MSSTATTSTSGDLDSKTARKRLLGGAVGTFVEWYDFLVYGLTAPIFAAQFFDANDPVAGLLGTFAIFAVGFLIRPLGGIVFGYMGDRIGRIKVLGITILLMGAATGVIGLLPTYASIGLLAPALLLLCRALQGFSTGGEHSGALSFVIESAPQNRRGFWIAIIYSASILPNLLLGFGMIGLRQWLGEDVYNDWGWRLPFFLGALLAAVGLWLRLRLSDPAEFENAKEEDATENPLKTALTKSYGAMLTVLFLLVPNLVGYYFLVTYMYTYAVTTLGVDANIALLSNTISSIVILLGVPFGGRLVDRIGRKPLMFIGTIWMFLSAYPAILLVETATVWGVILGQLLVALGVAAYVSGCVVTMLELFRTSSRYSAHGLSYGLGTAIFGGTTPLIAAALASSFGPSAPAFILIVAGLIGLAVLFFTPETRQVNLTTARIDLPTLEGDRRGRGVNTRDVAAGDAAERRSNAR